MIRGYKPVDLVLLFVRDEDEMRTQFSRWAEVLQPSGSIWAAWPKKSAAMPGDINENSVRHIGLDAGLVDNKVCSIDATWSALRFVIRLKDRPK